MWHTFNLLQNVQYTKEQAQIGDRGSYPVAINQFLIFFSIGSACSRSLFSFANIYYFMLLVSFDLILL